MTLTDYPKKSLEPLPPQFDLKFLLVGDSGSGKTHLCGTYTKGPVHLYMLDPGGEKTLYKLNKNRPEGSPLSVDSFAARKAKYSDFWKQIQKDEKSGFFDKMAELGGLVVLPDSISSASDMILQEIATKNGRTLTSQAAPMRRQDWGQATSWMKELISVANDLPCAVAVTAHLHIERDDVDGTVIGRYPLISGQLKFNGGRYFDEIYLLSPIGTHYNLYFKEVNKFQASSRYFTPRSVKDVTMDMLATAYLNGDDLSNMGKKEESKKT